MSTSQRDLPPSVSVDIAISNNTFRSKGELRSSIVTSMSEAVAEKYVHKAMSTGNRVAIFQVATAMPARQMKGLRFSKHTTSAQGKSLLSEWQTVQLFMTRMLLILYQVLHVPTTRHIDQKKQKYKDIERWNTRLTCS